MLNYYLDISVEDDFGLVDNYWTSMIVNPEYILSINGNKAIIDNRLFIGRNFFIPVQRLLNINKPISNITSDEFVKIFSDINCEIEKSESRTNIRFDSDNHLDIDFAYIENTGIFNRVVFLFKNSPITSFCLLDEDGVIKIIVSPFTKDYYVISESEWFYFVNYLTVKESVSEIRDSKINQILGNSDDKSANLIRQLRFYLSNKSNSFLSSVLSFYEKNGKITDKQFNAVAKSIGWICISK